MLRQSWHSSQSVAEAMDEVLAQLVGLMAPGAVHEGDPPLVTDCGVVAHSPRRDADAHEACAQGPVSLFMCQLARQGGSMDAEWRVYVSGFPVLHLMQDPWDGVVRIMLRVFFGQLFRDASAKRPAYGGSTPDIATSLCLPAGWDRSRRNL
eukprot:12410338-Alexandrium_andersonii.AAC.1